MEIKELTAFFVDKETNILDVTFRLIDDSDEIIRQDQIDYDLAEEYGYSIVPNHLSIPDDELIDTDIDEFEDIDVDKIELINKINENNLKMPEIVLDSIPIDDFISDILSAGASINLNSLTKLLPLLSQTQQCHGCSPFSLSVKLTSNFGL